MDILTELVTGPCKVNQDIVMDSKLDNLIRIMTRTVDDINSDYSQLRYSVLIFFLAMCEGNNPKILR